MRRLAGLVTASLGVAVLNRKNSPTLPFRDKVPCGALVEQRAGLRNLHQYPHARYKSLVKDRRRFARNWYLSMGDNYELVHESGHEREATENFAVYRDDSQNDRYHLFTSNLADLPAARRLDALTSLMRERWRVKDDNRGYDKAKLLLQALECFSEMRALGQMSPFAEMAEGEQDTFLQYVEGCARFAQACVHSHPDALAVLVRTAQICDELRCDDKRDEVIRATEHAARGMDRSYAFARPNESVPLKPPSYGELTEQHRLRTEASLRERFKHMPWVCAPKPRYDSFRHLRHRRVVLSPMKDDDPHRPLLTEPYRPERDSWSSDRGCK